MTTVIEYRPSAVRRNATVNWRGLPRRVFDALVAAMDESRRRQAEREIARYADLLDGRLTDALEREIERRLMKSDWRPRA